MKRFLALLLCLITVFALVACGGTAPDTTAPNRPTPPRPKPLPKPVLHDMSLLTPLITVDPEAILGKTLEAEKYFALLGVSYDDIWDYPEQLERASYQILGLALTENAGLAWEKVPADVRDNYLAVYEAYPKLLFEQNQGAPGFPYKTLDDYASFLFGYGDKYKTLREFAEASAKNQFLMDVGLYSLAESRHLAPTPDEVKAEADKRLVDEATRRGVSKTAVESNYTRLYGPSYYNEAVRQDLIREKLQKELEKEVTYKYPKISDKAFYDKSPIDQNNYEVTKDITDLVKFTIKTEDGKSGEIAVRLYSHIAPLTVKNFQKLVSEGFYNGLTFHRLAKDFCLQGGDPKGNGTGGSKDTVKGEFQANGVKNYLHHQRGVISMARSQSPDSASSQFFFVLSDKFSQSLDGNYAAFGYTVSGLEFLDELGKQPTSGETPTSKITVEKVEFIAPKQ